MLCLLDQIDERAAQLERLLDDHPGRHLLAEYEVAVLDRPGLVKGMLVGTSWFRSYIEGLLDRIDLQIVALSAASPPQLTIDFPPRARTLPEPDRLLAQAPSDAAAS